MSGRLLIVAMIALPCALGAHLAAVLLVAAGLVVVVVRLLPVLAPVGIIGTVLFLTGLIAVRVWQTGAGCRPVGRMS